MHGLFLTVLVAAIALFTGFTIGVVSVRPPQPTSHPVPIVRAVPAVCPQPPVVPPQKRAKRPSAPTGVIVSSPPRVVVEAPRPPVVFQDKHVEAPQPSAQASTAPPPPIETKSETGVTVRVTRPPAPVVIPEKKPATPCYGSGQFDPTIGRNNFAPCRPTSAVDVRLAQFQSGGTGDATSDDAGVSASTAAACK